MNEALHHGRGRPSRLALPTRYGLIILSGGFMLIGGVCSLPVDAPSQELRGAVTPICTALGIVCALLAGMEVVAPAAWRRLYARLRPLALAESVVLVAATLAVFAVGAFLTLFVPVSSSYWSDVISFSYTDAQLVTQGRNPYTDDSAFRGALARFPNALETPVRRGEFGAGYDYPSLQQIEQVRQEYVANPAQAHGEFDPRTLHSYPALSFLIYVPLLLMGLPNILLVNLVVYFGLFAWLLWQAPVGWRGWTALVAGSAAAAVLFSLFLETEVICVALLLFAWHYRRGAWSGAALLGFACAFKQYSWFFVPFFAAEVWRMHGGWGGWRASARFAAIALGACLLPNLPFIVASPVAWFTSLWVPMTAPLFPFGMGIINFSVGHLLPFGPPPLYAALEALALIATLVAFARYRLALGDAALLLALVPLFFAFRSSANYFAFAPWIALYAANMRYAEAGVGETPSWAVWAERAGVRAFAPVASRAQASFASIRLSATRLLAGDGLGALGAGGGGLAFDGAADPLAEAVGERLVDAELMDAELMDTEPVDEQLVASLQEGDDLAPVPGA